jgi:hypothetical protein
MNQHKELAVVPEADLAAGLDAWDDAWARRDAAALRALLRPDAVLHADGLLLKCDVVGADAIVALNERYFERWRYAHEVAATAVNADKRSALGCWVDVELARAERGGAPELQPPSAVVGFWRLAFDPAGKVESVTFLRQLNLEEAGRRLLDPSKAAHGGLEPGRYRGGPAPDAAARAAFRAAAEAYSRVWQGDEDADARVGDILTDDFSELDLMRGEGLAGRAAFVDQVRRLHDPAAGGAYEKEAASFDIGASRDSRVAIVHWGAAARVGGERVRQHGFSLLAFEREGARIREAVGLRSPSAPERCAILRADAFAHAREEQ